MTGLLGDPNVWADPRSSGNGLLAMAQAIAPNNRFVGGLLNYGNSMSAAQDADMKRKAFRMKMEADQMALEKAKRDSANEQGLLGLQSQFFQPGSAGMGGTSAVNAALPADLQIGAQSAIPAAAPRFDVKGYTAAAMNKGYMNPLDAIKLQQALAKDSQINKLDVKDFTPASVQKYAQTGNYADLERMDKLHFGDTGGNLVGLNPFTGKPVGSVPKTGNPYSDLIVSDGQGGMRPNMPLIGAKQSIAAAGAARNQNTVINAGETEWAKKRAGSFAEMMEGLNKQAFAAPAQLRKLERMEQLLAGVDGGKLAPTGMDIASVANSFGVKIDPKLGNKEAAESLAREIAGQFRQPGTGPMTDKDFENFLIQVPSLSKSAEGRRQITATMKAALARDMEVAKRARSYVAKNGKIDDAFLDEVSQFIAENPVIQLPNQWRVKR